MYRAVQAAAEAIPGMKRHEIASGYRTKTIGSDLTYVKCNGKWLPIGEIVDPINGLVLNIDPRSGEDAQVLQTRVEPIAKAVGAYTLISDAADAFKQAADHSGLDQQVCKSHVVRNTEEFINSLGQSIQTGKDTSLAEIKNGCRSGFGGSKTFAGIDPVAPTRGTDPTSGIMRTLCRRRHLRKRANLPRSLIGCGICSWTAETFGRA